MPPIVAESMKALSAFINSVLNCRMSELSALIVLIVALSAVTCDKVICVVAKLPIVAESIFALVPVIAFAVKTEFAMFVLQC